MQFTDKDYEGIVAHCHKATQINPKNMQAWHIFSTINDEASIYFSKKFSKEYAQHIAAKKGPQPQQNTKFLLHRDFGFNVLPKLLDKHVHPLLTQSVDRQISQYLVIAQKYVSHVVSAVTGLVQQLILSSQHNSASTTKTLQTTLRLLKIWFQHGNLSQIEQKLRQGFEIIDLKVWIEVIPQLLARIDINDEAIKQSLMQLVEKISMKFPQALIYSLSVTQQAKATQRREAVEQLIEKLKSTQPELIK